MSAKVSPYHSGSTSLSNSLSNSQTLSQSIAIGEDPETGLLLPKTPVLSSQSTSSNHSMTPMSILPTSQSALQPTQPSWFRRKLLNPMFDILKSGATVEGISLSLACGVTGGMFPVPAITTLACIVLSWLFTLNFPAVQITNLLATPLQLMTIIPFIRAGEWMFNVEPMAFSLSEFSENPFEAIRTCWTSLLRGICAWLVFLPPATAILYFAFRPIIRRVMANLKFT